MKQANLRPGGRALRQTVAPLQDPTADRANESQVDSAHSDSCRADCPIPHGIAMLIDILAREALEMVIAEQMELQARDDLREKTAKSVKRNAPANAARRRYKDQILS